MGKGELERVQKQEERRRETKRGKNEGETEKGRREEARKRGRKAAHEDGIVGHGGAKGVPVQGSALASHSEGGCLLMAAAASVWRPQRGKEGLGWRAPCALPWPPPPPRHPPRCDQGWAANCSCKPLEQPQ